MSDKTIKEIREIKAETQIRLAEAISAELHTFMRKTGLVPTGVSVSLLNHYTATTRAGRHLDDVAVGGVTIEIEPL